MLPMQVFPSGIMKQGYTVYGGRGLNAGQLREGGENIPQLRQLVRYGSGGNSRRIGNQQGDVNAALVGTGFPEGMVIPQQFPMVGSKKDYRILEGSVILQGNSNKEVTSLHFEHIESKNFGPLIFL